MSLADFNGPDGVVPMAQRIIRLEDHIRSLHKLNGWSKQKGWWCSCQAPIIPRRIGQVRPWDGREFALAVHAMHVDEILMGFW